MSDETTEKSEAGGSTAESQRAATNWTRYEYIRSRGHRDYCDQALKNERYYLGGGKQWDDAVKESMGGRPTYEQNEIMPALNTAIGYQIHNRMDIGFKPRGGDADDDKAKIFQKVAMQIADENKLHWVETQVFSDGLIEQRGYFDIRMSFEKNVTGDIVIRDEDPMDILPDPDARTYDPEDGWHDVTKTGWMTYDEVEQFYGKEARAKIEGLNLNEPAPGDADEDTPRNHFGDRITGTQFDAFYAEGLIKRVRVIDRQYVQYEMSKVLVNIDTGEIKLSEPLTPDVLSKHLTSGEWIGSKRMMRRVYWLVTTRDVVLHDKKSPYPFFTIVPYFAYFRRGVTAGMVDNAISPQDVLNKSISSAVHIVNSVANSGWKVEENSLVNMTEDDLEETGAETGLVITYRKGTTPPEKIQANQVPTGVDRLIERANMAVKDVTVPDAMRGTPGQEVSGIALQSKQFASQQQLAVPLDNLAKTRHMLGKKIMWFMQNFMTDRRILRITETDPATMRQVHGAAADQRPAARRHLPQRSHRRRIRRGDYRGPVADHVREQPVPAVDGDAEERRAHPRSIRGEALDPRGQERDPRSDDGAAAAGPADRGQGEAFQRPGARGRSHGHGEELGGDVRGDDSRQPRRGEPGRSAARRRDARQRRLHRQERRADHPWTPRARAQCRRAREHASERAAERGARHEGRHGVWKTPATRNDRSLTWPRRKAKTATRRPGIRSPRSTATGAPRTTCAPWHAPKRSRRTRSGSPQRRSAPAGRSRKWKRSSAKTPKATTSSTT
jgi:hypothetical protein